MLIDSSTSTPLPDILIRIRPLLEEIGDIKVAKIVLLQQEALEHSNNINQEGFIPVIVHNDLDIQFALEAMELIYNEKIEILALATENEKLLPLFSRAREIGKEVILLHSANYVNRGLQNAADIVLPMSL
ncbi:MAG: NYN domain-containing protein [Candidatus Hermodarchaeota archaeon]|nr:NYN domain-containing protein [Candidatus Hermodarchaeota archaeon]